jgi:hypothetical protein
MVRCWESIWRKYGWIGYLVYFSMIYPKYSSAQVLKALIGKGFRLDLALLVLVDLSFKCYDRLGSRICALKTEYIKTSSLPLSKSTSNPYRD